MSDWEHLLAALTRRPRENGSPGLSEAADAIARRLDEAGLAVERHGFDALPHEPMALGIAVLILCCAYAVAMRLDRPRTASLVALMVLALPVLQVDWGVPLTPGWTVHEENVEAAIPAKSPERRLVLTAHYDSKTETTDHLIRTPVQLVGAVFGLVALGIAVLRSVRPDTPRRRRASRWIARAAPVYGVAFAVVFAGGAARSARSEGALDNAAACAVLMRAGELLAEASRPARTEVVLLFLAAEEVGAQGAWHWVDERLPALRPLPTHVVNLDPVGASLDLTVVHREGALLRTFSPSPPVVEALDAAHRAALGTPIGHTAGGGLTDAFPFLARGIPAATVISAVPPFVLPRGMHTPADVADRVDPAGLDAALALVLELVRQTDARD